MPVRRQQQDAELRDSLDHRLLLATRRKDRVLERPQLPQYRRTKQDSGDQLPDHRGLADPQPGLAQQAPGYQEQYNLA
jgi:hypothetical protein